MEIENENLLKKLENGNIPNIETPGHKARLKSALFSSDRFKERQYSFLSGKMAMAGLSGVFLLLLIFGTEQLFPDEPYVDREIISVPEINLNSSSGGGRQEKNIPGKPDSLVGENATLANTDYAIAAVSVISNKGEYWEVNIKKIFDYSRDLKNGYPVLKEGGKINIFVSNAFGNKGISGTAAGSQVKESGQAESSGGALPVIGKPYTAKLTFCSKEKDSNCVRDGWSATLSLSVAE